jgi:hypothetical protein
VDEPVVWWNAIGAETPFGFCCAETSAGAFAWETPHEAFIRKTPKEGTVIDGRSGKIYHVSKE